MVALSSLSGFLMIFKKYCFEHSTESISHFVEAASCLSELVAYADLDARPYTRPLITLGNIGHQRDLLPIDVLHGKKSGPACVGPSIYRERKSNTQTLKASQYQKLVCNCRYMPSCLAVPATAACEAPTCPRLA